MKRTQPHAKLQSTGRRRLLRGTAHGVAGALLMPALGSSLLAACGGGDGGAGPVAPTPRLASVNNFRDLGGADDDLAYRTSNGQKIRRSVFYRSNALTPSAADLATLNTLGITAVYDLRTTAEVATAPDTLPAGARYQNINILGTGSASVPNLATAADAVAMMEQIEISLVTDAGMRERLGQLFTDLANGADAQLFHCTASKDRTGWVAAVLLTFAGVPPSDVMRDYLLTNTYSAASIQSSYDGMVAAYGQAYADAFYPLLGVQESFLQAGLDQVAASYGSMQNYVANGLGLSAATRSLLLGKLLK
jgi:protein-tyrosine phosphatase